MMTGDKKEKQGGSLEKGDSTWRVDAAKGISTCFEMKDDI